MQDKAAFTRRHQVGEDQATLTVEPTDQKARVFGNMAIVTGGASVHVVQNGNDLTFKIRYTNARTSIAAGRGRWWRGVRRGCRRSSEFTSVVDICYAAISSQL